MRILKVAQISFKISEEVFKTTDINNLVIFYYDEENDTIKFLETEVDEETNTIKQRLIILVFMVL